MFIEKSFEMFGMESIGIWILGRWNRNKYDKIWSSSQTKLKIFNKQTFILFTLPNPFFYIIIIIYGFLDFSRTKYQLKGRSLFLHHNNKMLRGGRTNIPSTNRSKMLCCKPYAARSSSLMCPMNNCVTIIIPNEDTRATIPGNAITHSFLDSFQTLLFKSELLSSSGERSLSSIELSMILSEKNSKIIDFPSFSLNINFILDTFVIYKLRF